MRILGTGVDLVEVPRFSAVVKRKGERFLKHLFTPAEVAYARRRKQAVQHLAARFAAKEAVVKALGAPKGLGLKWSDLEISNDAAGQPRVTFRGTMSRWKKARVYLSLTHTSKYAVASAVVCSR